MYFFLHGHLVWGSLKVRYFRKNLPNHIFAFWKKFWIFKTQLSEQKFNKIYFNGNTYFNEFFGNTSPFVFLHRITRRPILGGISIIFFIAKFTQMRKKNSDLKTNTVKIGRYNSNESSLNIFFSALNPTQWWKNSAINKMSVWK